MGYLVCLLLWLPVSGHSTEPGHPSTSQATSGLNDDDLCSFWEKKAASSDEPATRCQASLEAARCILISPCSSALSPMLQGDLKHRVSLRETASKVLALLDESEDALRSAQLEDGAETKAGECIELLRTFAEVFHALGAAPTTGPATDELLTACSRLAEYFDDLRPGVAEAAKLWQGVAYRRAGRPERAIQVLRPILSVPTSRRIGFWARLERCRALGDQGDYAAGIALSLRLSARVDAWFEEEDRATRQQAVDSVRWIRIELLRDWARRLDVDGESERAREAEADAQQLLGSDPWPVPPDRWLSLGPPIPDLPQCHVEATSQPSVLPTSGEVDDD